MIPYDLLKRDSTTPGYIKERANWWNVPLINDPDVIACQLIAILLGMLFATSELTDMFTTLTVGYSSKIKEQFPGASELKY